MNKLIVSLLLTLGITSAAVAAEGPLKGDATAGQAKAAVCGACHGPDGNSPAPNFPKLAGQGERYLTKQMQDIIDKYKSNGTSYLLPIITREDGSERRQYQNQMRKINRLLKDIANQARLPLSLSMYYTRHSWATIARGRDVPLAVISEGLGHDSETTTQIYLDSIKSSEVDKVNRMILEGL